MRRLNSNNLWLIEQVATRFDYLLEKVVFVGGTVVDLLISDPGAPEARGSTDVDVIVEVASMVDYHKLREPLIALGFTEMVSDATPLVCRWGAAEITVDIMPTDESILGFSNEWYIDAIKTSEWVKINDNLSIRRISGPYFLMTKLAAFMNRGNSDFMASRDIEDVIAVLDGRPEIIDEIEGSLRKLKEALGREISRLLQNEDFLDALPGHLIDTQRLPILLKKLQAIVTVYQE
jgi:predicted nucleotidyltransferase